MRSEQHTAPAAIRAVRLADEAASEALGAALGRAVPLAAGAPLALHLRGPLGAGKTTLARALLRALGVQGSVKSPSYTLLEPYATPDWTVLHLDLYRLADPDELEALGLREEWLPGRLLVVEWPERAQGRLPAPDLLVHLSEPQAGPAIAAGGRDALIEARGPAGLAWLRSLARHYPL